MEDINKSLSPDSPINLDQKTPIPPEKKPSHRTRTILIWVLGTIIILVSSYFLYIHIILGLIAVETGTSNSTNAFLRPDIRNAEVRNEFRKDTLAHLATAIQQYKSEHSTLPVEITNKNQFISKNEADLCSYLVPDYLPALPIDSKEKSSFIKDCTQDYNTNYQIKLNTDGSITVLAPYAEVGETLSLTRQL